MKNLLVRETTCLTLGYQSPVVTGTDVIILTCFAMLFSRILLLFSLECFCCLVRLLLLLLLCYEERAATQRRLAVRQQREKKNEVQNIQTL